MDVETMTALGLRVPERRIDPPAGPRDVASILDESVRRHPEDEALADPDRRYSFAALDSAVYGAAHFFDGLGVAQGDRVAASLPNGCDIVIAFLAVQRLGAIWVGINRILAPAEKAHILQHSGTRLLLTDSATGAELAPHADALPELQDILLIEAHGRDAARWAQAIAPDQAREKLRRDIDPFAPAAIMYTSGTTGAPKGVVHSQHNIITACAAGSTAGAVAPQARRGVVLPLTITNLMIMGPLYAFWNGKACICGQTVKTAPLVEWLHREQVGSISAVPTMVYDILEADLDLPEGFSMGAGGAPLPEPVRQAYYKRHHKHVLQSYGLTEAPTVVAETRFVEPPEGASGMILPHLSVTIRDADGNILPVGETGEICIAAVSEGPWAGVYTPPLGYWRDPERTEALLKGGVLHTSDLGRFDDAGWLYLADRSSELILRGGSNVYPAEVERVLHGHDGVADCAVVGKPDPRLGMRTVAFIQPAAAAMGDEKLVGELVALCHSALARYKTPDDWVFLHEFPRNAMGKIMKPALRQQLLAGEHGK